MNAADAKKMKALASPFSRDAGHGWGKGDSNEVKLSTSRPSQLDFNPRVFACLCML